MCAIIGSFDIDKFKHLYKLNTYRGALSYSFASFDTGGDLQHLKRNLGEMPDDIIESTGFMLGHTQAPTTESVSIHPAHKNDSYLWHNGIIKQGGIPGGVWDTEWLLDVIMNQGFKSLSSVDGSFACMFYHRGNLFVFRNEISPLFYDNTLNISSTKFDGGISLPANTVFKIDLLSKELYTVDTFETFENPYFFME